MDKMGRNIIPGWIGKQKPASLLRYILVDFGPTCALREFLKGSRRLSLPPLLFVLDRRLHIDFSPLLSLSLFSGMADGIFGPEPGETTGGFPSLTHLPA